MKLIIIAILALTACTTQVTIEDQRIDNARMVVSDACGPSPLPPGLTVETATLGTKTRVWVDLADWNALRAYQYAAEAWSACVEGRTE